MAKIIYGTGALYGDADSDYGRISNDLAQAMAARTREPGLRVKVTDERVNRWSSFAGSELNADSFISEGFAIYDQRYYSYRGQADICKLDNGNLVRIRNNSSTRDIEFQIIADPTVASQWTTWNSYNTDDNFAVAIAPDVNAGIYYHAKIDGLYRDNSLVWARTGITKVKCHRSEDGRQVKDALWIRVVTQGVTATDGTILRKFQYYWTPDVTTITPVEVEWNWVWQRMETSSIEREDSKIIKISAFPLYGAADDLFTSESVLTTVHEELGDVIEYQIPRLVRGISDQSGSNTISNADIFKLPDGFFYLVYHEAHLDQEQKYTSNFARPLIWQRSKDGEVWGEPVHCGFTLWSLAGLIESGNFVYLAGNGEVQRRPNTPVVYDISDYVTRASWDSPRDNQVGDGTISMANPAGINNFLEDLNDRRITIEPGLRLADSSYEFIQLDDFWLSSTTKEIDGAANRLEVSIGNIWNRLENPLRDVFNFIGQTEFDDWKSGKSNAPSNYYFHSGAGSATVDNRLEITEGIALWAGWKGYNPTVSFGFDRFPMDLIFRYIDDKNYLHLNYDGNSLRLYERIAGVDTQVGSTQTVGTISRLGVKCLWRKIELYADSVLETVIPVSTYSSPRIVRPGYVGFRYTGTGAYKIWDLNFTDEEYNYTSLHLIRQALALADYHEPKIGGALAKQYDLAWGPQTDLPTPADALRQLLEVEKLELIWRDGYIEVGQFKDLTIVKVLEDEIIQTEQVGEANRRTNLVVVDGNEHTWTEIDAVDAQQRDRMIQTYYDFPELTTRDEVMNRAQEEIRRSKLGQSPGGRVILPFDLWRMDPVTWVDNLGNAQDVRIEGISVEIEQGEQPSQRATIDTSKL